MAVCKTFDTAKIVYTQNFSLHEKMSIYKMFCVQNFSLYINVHNVLTEKQKLRALLVDRYIFSEEIID